MLWAVVAEPVTATESLATPSHSVDPSSSLSPWQAAEDAAAIDQWQLLLEELGFLPFDSEFPSISERALALNVATEKLLRYRADLRAEPLGSATAPLHEAKNNGALASFLARLVPDYEGFRQLRRALQRERQVDRIPVPSLAPLQDLSLGQSHPDIIQLRRALAQRLGEALSPVLQERDVWDPPFIAQLKRYQGAQGIPASGRLDAATRGALESPRSDPTALIQYSLRQWYQLPDHLPDRAFLVNIPHFELLVLEQQQVTMVVPTIVGKPATPTPRLNSRFGSINLNPSWTPPASIVQGELLPQWRADPDSLWRQGFQLVKGQNELLPWQQVDHDNIDDVLRQYRLRQQPGSNNPLGKARFNLQNSGAIYLHDTNNKRLFRKSHRALSHGCVRVGDFEQLLERLGRTQPDARQRRIRSALQTGRTYTESVSDSYEIFIVYMPAWPGGDGSLHLAQDIYQWLDEEKMVL